MKFTDVEMAILSQLAYKDVKQGESLYNTLLNNSGYLKGELGSQYESSISGLITKVKDSGCIIAKSQNNTASGFAAYAVSDPVNNDVMVACRGTEMGQLLKNPGETVKDVYEDVTLALKSQTNQQADMAAFMEAVKAEGYDQYSFTGHSLGGNLAMYGAITLGDASKVKSCTSFNSPGFNVNFWEANQSSIDALKGVMTSYQNERDSVSECFKVPGEVVVLECKGLDAVNTIGVDAHLLKKLVIGKNGKFKKNHTGKKDKTALGKLFKEATTASDLWLELTGLVNNTLVLAGVGAQAINLRGNVGTGSSKRIELTPEEIKNQAAQMVALNGEYENIFTSVSAELNLVNKNWSANLANNFAGKIRSVQNGFKDLLESLAAGAAAANLAAVSFEAIDKSLAQLVNGDMQNQNQNQSGTVGSASVLLNHNMTGPICQYDPQYSAAFSSPYGYNAGCCATIYATGLSIVNGHSYNPTDFWYDGATHYDQGGLSGYIHGFDANSIYESLLAGKPAMCHYGHNLEGGQHYVLITGVSENADLSALTYKDFIAIDPATGTQRTMAEIESAYPGMNLWGHHLFT